MFDTQGPHRLLAQVPLTVSPFLSLPSAVTLPYSFRSVPTSLPPSIVADGNGGKPKYITSSSGHTAHPDEIINSCNALQDHVAKTAEEAQKLVRGWEQGIKDRELAEKRRVAPGWLDREEKILEPTKPSNNADHNLLDAEASTQVNAPAMSPSRQGEELDRAFGGLVVNNSLSTGTSVTISAQVTNSNFRGGWKMKHDNAIGFLQDPLESWWSAFAFLTLCVVLLGVVMFLVQQYLEVLGFSWCRRCCSYRCSYHIEHPTNTTALLSSDSAVSIDTNTITKTESTTHYSSHLDKSIKSTTLSYSTVPRIVIGEVGAGQIARRRKASFGGLA